jgi:CII-binding regulator of phage lambda lysogenization HflD
LAQEVDQSMMKIQGTVEVVSNLANAVGLNSGARLAQIQEISHGMGKQVLELENGYKNLANQFSQSLQKGDEQLTKYLQGVAESETRFFKDADQATAKLCNNLLQAANYLVAAEDNNRREHGDSQS